MITEEQRKLLRSHAETAIRLENSAGLSTIQPVFNAKPEIVLSLLDLVDRLERALKIIASGDIAPSSIDCYIDEYYSKLARQALEGK